MGWNYAIVMSSHVHIPENGDIAAHVCRLLP